MEQLDSDYVDYLHQQQTNPYATKVIQGREDTQWVVHLLTDDLEDKVFMTLLKIKEVSLNDLPKLSVEKVEIQELGADKLLEIFNSEDNQTYFSIMPIIACSIFGNMKSKFDRCKVISVKGIVGAVVTLLFMTLGYVVFGAIIAGSFAAGLASAPGLLLKSVVNMVVYLFVATGMSKILGRK